MIKYLFILALIWSITSCRKDAKIDTTDNPSGYNGGGTVCFSGRILDESTLEPIEGALVQLHPTGLIPTPSTSNNEGIYLAKYSFKGQSDLVSDFYPGNVEIYVLTDSTWGSLPTEYSPTPGIIDTIYQDILIHQESPILNDLTIEVTPTAPTTWSINNLELHGTVTHEGAAIPIDKYDWRSTDRFAHIIGLSANAPSWLWDTSVSGIHEIEVHTFFRIRDGITGLKSIKKDTTFYVKQMYPWIYGASEAEHKTLRDKFVGDWSANCVATWSKEWNAQFNFDSTLYYTADVVEDIVGHPVSVFDHGRDNIEFNEKRFFIDSVAADGDAFGWLNLKLYDNPTIISTEFGDLHFADGGDSLYFTVYRSPITYIKYALKKN